MAIWRGLLADLQRKLGLVRYMRGAPEVPFLYINGAVTCSLYSHAVVSKLTQTCTMPFCCTSAFATSSRNTVTRTKQGFILRCSGWTSPDGPGASVLCFIDGREQLLW